MIQTINQIVMDTYETIDGKWWLFSGGVPVRPLTDEEAAGVIWGDELIDDTVGEYSIVDQAEAIRNFNRALQAGRSVMAEMKVDDD